MADINYECLKAVMNMVGGIVRVIHVDYRDKDEKYYNVPAYVPCLPTQNITTDNILNRIIIDLGKQGHTVAAIAEFMNGHTPKSLAGVKAGEYMKHCRVLYMNPSEQGGYFSMNEYIERFCKG